MWCNQIFSLIKEQTVQNVIVCDNYEIANQLARMQCGDEAYAVDTTQYPVSIGCKRIDGVFYEEDGKTEIPRTLTADEEVAVAKVKLNVLSEQQTELALETDYRLSLIELGLV